MVHHFGHDAERDETDDARPPDCIASQSMHGSHHAATDD
jgi:hypothetical protein